MLHALCSQTLFISSWAKTGHLKLPHQINRAVLSLPRLHLLRLTDGHVIAILAFVSCVLYALVLSLLNLGPKQVNQQSFTQLLAFYSLLISSTITAKTHQAVYGQMRFILPRIAIKLRVNCLNISINISFCILQQFYSLLSFILPSEGGVTAGQSPSDLPRTLKVLANERLSFTRAIEYIISRLSYFQSVQVLLTKRSPEFIFRVIHIINIINRFLPRYYSRRQFYPLYYRLDVTVTSGVRIL